MSPPELERWPEVGDRFTSLADFKLACFRFGASIGCELRVLKSQPDNIYIGCNLPDRRRHARTCDFRISCRVRGQEAVVTNVKAKAGHSCDPVELERRRQSGHAAETMRKKIAMFDGGAAADRKRRREIGVEGMSTTLSKKFTPMSYAGIEVNEYAGESARLPALHESFPSSDSAIELCLRYATSCGFWLESRWQPDEEQYLLECTPQSRKTRASSSSGTCPYKLIISQDWDGVWYRRPSELEHNHSITYFEPTLSADNGVASSNEVLSVPGSRRAKRNTARTASASNSFETASFAIPSTSAEVKKRSIAHLHMSTSSPLSKKPRSGTNTSQPPDDLVAFAAGLRQPISGAAGEASKDAQALVALGVHSINDLVQLVCLAPSTVQAMIAECESEGRAEGVSKALLQARP